MEVAVLHGFKLTRGKIQQIQVVSSFECTSEIQRETGKIVNCHWSEANNTFMKPF